MYSVSLFGHMIADKIRVDAYTEALRRAIFPGATVVEIGSGTGFFSMIACQLGAGKVYAIEPNDAIAVAELTAAANGFSDRIQFLSQLSTTVNLPEQADVLFSDLRGTLPLHTHHLPSIIDARKRLLKPNGVQIPGRDHISVALVGGSKHYEKELGHWDRSHHGLDWSAARNLVVNRWWRATIEQEELLSPGSRLLTLDYATIEKPNAAGTVLLTPSASGTAYGLALYFDTELVDGVGFSTGPGHPRTIYSIAFFPFEAPLTLTPSDGVQIDIRADLIGPEYVWGWKTAVNGQIQFSQSTFKGELVSPRRFRKATTNHQPALNSDGVEIRWILEQIDGTRSNQQLASALQARFPERFPTLRSALNRVVETVGAFC
jgi:protein arginine N-methyltransferase 1